MKRAFNVRYKAFFIIFKGLSVGENYLWPESAPLEQIVTGLKSSCPEVFFNKYVESLWF